MKLYLLFIVWCGAVAANNMDAVVNLSSDNITDVLEASNMVLVQYYAPWCGYCKQIMPDYYKAAQKLREDNVECTLGRFDGTTDREFTESLGIRGYPTFLLYKNGRQIATYTGRREYDHIVQYIKSKSGPSATLVNTVSDMMLEARAGPAMKDTVSDTNRIHSKVILGIFRNNGTDVADSAPQGVNSAIAKTFLAAAEESDETIKFLISSSDDILHHFKVPLTSAATIVSMVYPPMDLSPVVRRINANRTSIDDMRYVIAELSVPSIVQFSPSNYRSMQGPYVPKAHVLLFCDVSSAMGEACLDVAHVVSVHYRGRLLFVHIPVSETHVYKTFHVSTDDQPKVIIVNMTDPDNTKKYVMDTPVHIVDEDDSDSIPESTLTEESLREFLDDYLAGRLAQTLSTESEEEEELNDDDHQISPVVRVVSTNFDDIVVESAEHVILFVVASWCAHCKSIEPVIQALGQLFQGVRTSSSLSGPQHTGRILVAKIDGSKNDIGYPDIRIRGFPTILLFRKDVDTVSVVEFNGERTVKDIIQFLRVNDIELSTDVSLPEDEL